MKDPAFDQAAAAHDAQQEQLHAPWNQDYEGVPHRCDWECREEVQHEGDVCDLCLVANAKMCGDWDEESIDALARIYKRTNNPQQCLKN